MHILLIYPEFPDTFWSFKHALKFIRKKASSPPLGLLTIASMLPKEWDLQLVDMNVNRLKQKQLQWADYVFISAMTIQRDSAREVIAQCNAMGVPVVAGGPLFTTEPENFEGVDHFILNEAEITLPEFLPIWYMDNQKRLTRQRYLLIYNRHLPDVGFDPFQGLREHGCAIFARLPVQLRFLQCDRAARPSNAPQDQRPDDRGTGCIV